MRSSRLRTRLRDTVCFQVLAASLTITSAGCLEVWAPLVGVSAATNAVAVANNAKPQPEPALAPSPKPTETAQAGPAPSSTAAAMGPPSSAATNSRGVLQASDIPNDLPPTSIGAAP